MTIVQKPLADPRVHRAVVRILRRNALCSIATVGLGRIAHINTAYFAYSARLDCCFYSYPDSAHARNLCRHPSAAIAVFDSAQTWGKADRGLQMFGSCWIARPGEEERIRRLYGARFPRFARWYRSWENRGERFPLRAFVFVPTTVKLFDERIFGSGTFVVSRVRDVPRAVQRSDVLERSGAGGAERHEAVGPPRARRSNG